MIGQARVNERETALGLLEDILSDGGKKGYNNLLLKDCLKNINDAVQKRFITELVNGVLRNLIYLDYIIAAFADIAPKKMKPFIQNVLRLSAYQIIFMDKVPDYAAINEAVKLCRKRGFGGLSGFVNAVLRKIAANIKNIALPNKDSNPAGYLSVIYSMPEWVVNMWLAEYGYGKCEEICAALCQRPCVTICVNTLKTSVSELIENLKSENIEATETAHPFILKILDSSDLSELAAFKNGYFHVMDVSAAMAADMLEVPKGAEVLDVCAAPGGKAFYMAERLEAAITACDIYPHKLELIRKSALRLGLDINTVHKDAATYSSEFAEKFDGVFVDVPCSGFGVLRKKPDIKLRITAHDIEALAETQSGILNNSALYVKSGGVLVYSTCTLSKRENEDVVTAFLAKGSFSLVREREILPTEYNSDGFYAAGMFKRD